MRRPTTGVPPPPFQSFFMGGFECSSHRRTDRRRLDLLAATGHDRHAEADYRTLRELGIATVRDGVRWHLIEREPGRYDWSSLLPMLRAARALRTEVIWDLCHYGWPDHVEFWSPDFVDAFARFAAATAKVIAEESGNAPTLCPVNEISYWAWAGGEVGRFNPAAHGRGAEVKQHLVRSALAGIAAIRAAVPEARIIQIDPAIHVRPRPDRPRDARAAERYRLAQYEAFDMLEGRQWPTLGGLPGAFDMVGLNYYSDNQWYMGGSTIPPGHPDYRPFREILLETHERYGRPLLVAETGAEGQARVGWLRYVAAEVLAAIALGCPVLGICIYPVTHYPGWANGRLCRTGLLGLPDADGHRPVEHEVVVELYRQQAILRAALQSPDLACA